MSEATSTSAGTFSGDPLENLFRPSTAMVSGDIESLSPMPTLSQSLPFSSGNPRIEETRGVMHLYKDDDASSSSELPVGRKALLCVLGVPNHMTYADFCQFCGSFVQHMLEMRIVRVDGMEDRYSILIRFDDLMSSDTFYKHFNGRRFSSLEVEACHILFTVDVQYTGSIEHAQTSPASSTEQASCPVCLGIFLKALVMRDWTKIWVVFSQPSATILSIVLVFLIGQILHARYADIASSSLKNLNVSFAKHQRMSGYVFFVVLLVAEGTKFILLYFSYYYAGFSFVPMTRYKEGHAIRHWKETQHCYSLELETQRVWDYVGDNYVHRLIQSKTDGKLVELNHHGAHADDCGSCECGGDPGFTEALWNSKFEAMVNEYNDLLTTQLENQKVYYESRIQEVEEETEREVSEAVEKALNQNPKLQKMQVKLDKYMEEKKFLEDINDNLLRNTDIWKAKIVEIEEREKKATSLKDIKIQELEEQLMGLMVCLEEGNNKVEEIPALSNESKDMKVLSSSNSSSTKTTPRTNKKLKD
ncbi:hypothetical protein LguiB_023116 [Lonicera macranthoides]